MGIFRTDCGSPQSNHRNTPLFVYPVYPVFWSIFLGLLAVIHVYIVL